MHSFTDVSEPPGLGVRQLYPANEKRWLRESPLKTSFNRGGQMQRVHPGNAQDF
jgi:hypothetical protein